MMNRLEALELDCLGFRPTEWRGDGICPIQRMKSTKEIVKSLKESLRSSASTSLTSNLTLADKDGEDGPVLSVSDIGTEYTHGENDRSVYPSQLPGSYEIIPSWTAPAEKYFILLVNKAATYHLLESYFLHGKFRCFIAFYAGHGDDKSTVPFLRKMKQFVNLPVLALVEWDPKSLKLLHKLKQLDLKHDIMWLGLRYDDFKKFQVPDDLMLKMTKKDMSVAQELQKDESFQKNPLLADALEIMLKTNKKAECDLLEALGANFLPRGYFPLKLQQHDWIRF